MYYNYWITILGKTYKKALTKPQILAIELLKIFGYLVALAFVVGIIGFGLFYLFY